MKRKKTSKKESIEKRLWKSADKLRKNIDAAEYKHIVLGLVFLKYISESFGNLYEKLKEGKGEYEGADPEDIDERLFSSHLYTADLPDPDLILRTSGEVRISNFLLWQLAYSELYFTDIYWPGFRKIDFLRAVRSYQMRKRRFGR